MLTALLLSTVLHVPTLADGERTFPFDPVALLDGREVEGSEELTAKRYRFTYCFASEENRAAFEAEPERFEIQLGGACARMGPLSGVGRVGIWTVHDSRLYIFASEACRKGFLAAPERLLEGADPVPEAAPEERDRGRQILARAVEGVGGAAALDRVSNLLRRERREVESGGRTWIHRRELTLGFPGKVREEEAWDDDAWATVQVGDDAWSLDASNDWTLHPTQRRAFERQMARELPVILRARERPDFVAASAGTARVGDVEVDLLRVSFDGATTTLGVDRESGRVLTARFRGRGPSMALGEVERTYSDFRPVGGLVLPFAQKAAFGGEPAPSQDRSFASIELDVELPEGTWSRPGS